MVGGLTYDQMRQQLRQQTGYGGDFGQNAYLQWLSRQPQGTQQAALNIIGRSPGGSQSANDYLYDQMRQQLREQTGYQGGFGENQYLDWLGGQGRNTQQTALGIIGRTPGGSQSAVDYLTERNMLAPATPAVDPYDQMRQQLREQTGYQDQFGDNQYLDWLGQQSPSTQNTALGIIAQSPEGAMPAAQYLVQNQPAQSDRPPQDPSQAPAVSPQWQQWAAAFGLDPSRWEGYGVETGTTVNPWDMAEQFGVPQGVLRAALNQLGFSQDYGFGRGQAAIDMFGESNVADMISQLGYSPTMPEQQGPSNITAYQPNYASFYNPMTMAEATMGGVPITFDSPMYRSTMVPVQSPQQQAQPGAGGPYEGEMWDAQGLPTVQNPLHSQFFQDVNGRYEPIPMSASDIWTQRWMQQQLQANQ